MLSRRITRKFLLQYLYMCIFQKDIAAAHIEPVCLEEKEIPRLDTGYFRLMHESIRTNEAELLAIIARLAPKFEVETLPKVHTLILMIALAEIQYWQGGDIDSKVSVNEAVELAKHFSDEQGKNFINGTLATFVRNMGEYTQIQGKKPVHIFA